MRSRTPAGIASAAIALAAAAVAFAPQANAATAEAATATPLCSASQLTAALGGGDAGAGQIYTYLVVTNHSSSACQVTGYPGLSMLDAHGAQIGVPATRESMTYNSVVLAPGASASDTIHTVNRQTNNPGECLPTSTDLRMYAPGSKVALTFAGKITDCDHTFSVTPFGPGNTGNPSNGPQPTQTPTGVPSATPTQGASGGNGGGTGTPTPSASASAEVTAVPSGAPDTGLASTSSGSGDTGLIVAGAAGVLVLGGAGAAARRRSRSRARG
ncbi:DUF4232 domain-containing protein [Streptacidiphilus fuscans]|uniref:DUF4232 domain-containing protein n=1 Tax=Streptacidiphilus fuscans TaxID=2789292 RepID=A0A931FE29_9ACTN|nr:DUF4232 domain-containing protein [Streptacidiphilus fuscans]MBF9068735.1 DUF4232 domain-containing protein [Streptacidiphilus fuscans]